GAVGVDERDDEVELRLAGGEAALDRLGAPPELAQLGDHPRTGLAALGRRDLAESAYGLVGDAGLDGGSVPAADDHRGAHADAEGALLLQVRRHRREPGAEVVALPVDDRSLGEVGEVALELRELAVEHERGADQRGAALGRDLVEAQRLRPPLALDPGPGGGLEEG